MIEVKLSFANQAELLAFFAGAKPLVSADEKTAVANITADKPVKGKPEPKAEAFDPNSDKTQRIPREVIEQAKKDAAASAQPAATAASSASPEGSTTSASTGFDYNKLREGVALLVNKNRARALEVIASFGVKTFKELDEARWPEAMAAVSKALEE